jgi:hypothetical protein
VSSLEDEGSDEIDEVAGDSVRVTDEVESKFNQLLFQLSFQRNYDILNSNKSTVKSFLELVTLSWHSSSQAK